MNSAALDPIRTFPNPRRGYFMFASKVLVIWKRFCRLEPGCPIASENSVRNLGQPVTLDSSVHLRSLDTIASWAAKPIELAPAERRRMESIYDEQKNWDLGEFLGSVSLHGLIGPCR
jgi:hypothetical protein